MPATKGKKLSAPVKLKGYILPEDKTGEDEADDSEEEFEEEEQQPEFLDMAEIDKVSSGGRLFHSRVPLCKVRFQTFSGDEYQVEGRFALRGPWWKVTCSTVKQRGRLVVKGFPSYNLRSDLDRENWIQMVSLFLTACGVEDQCKSLFFNWLPQNRDVSLNNLMEVLGEFSKGGNKDQAGMIITRLSNSVAWMQVQASSLYPGVMKYLPTLLPRQFTELFGMAKKSPTLPATQATQAGVSTQQDDGNQEQEEEEEDSLAKLEHIIANDVWKLGFNSLVYRELKLVRCEAQLRAFEECGLLQKIPPLQRFSLMAYNQLKKHCSSEGSTYMNHKKLWESLTKDEKMSYEQAWIAINFLREQAVVVIESNAGPCKVILHNFDFYETGIAKCLRTLVERGPWKIPVNPVEVLQAAAEERQQQAGTCCPMKLDQDHVQAAKMICTNPVTIISGKAGCGKTTVVSQLFRAAVLHGSCEKQDIQKDCADYKNDIGVCLQSQEDEDEQRPIQSDNEILLTAPTGRAASLLSKKTKFKAYTLHQVLFGYMNKKKNLDQWKFKNVRILVIDEGSLVPVQLLHSVLSLLIKHAELRKFIILGDVKQLPSIQPGNILFDLFKGLKGVGWAIEMRTNHRSESQLIVDNAGRIADMRTWKLTYDAKVDLDGSHDALTADKKFILIRLPSNGSDDDLQRAVRFLIDTAPGLKDHATSQFISFKRTDVSLINEICCQHYNKHTTKNHKNKLMFQPGDKVCCTRNGYVTVDGDDDCNDLNETDVTNETQSPEKREKSSMRLCNGEIFFIRADTTKDEGKRHSRYLTLDDGDGRVFTVNFRELQRECKLQHAWARTIHTYQGSENETIVYVVGDSVAQRWKHIYTAVTRAQKRVYVVSREQAIKLAIEEYDTERMTRLSRLVKNQLVHPWMLVGTPEAQPNTPKGTPTGCCPQQSTPLHTQTPGRSSSFNLKPTLLQPKRLWENDEEDEEAAQSSAGDNVCSLSAEQLTTHEATKGDKERHRAAMSGGHKRQRMLSAEHEEMPCKESQADCF